MAGQHSDPGASAAQMLRVLSEVLTQAAEPIRLLRTILELAVARTKADRGVFVEIGGKDDFNFRVLHRFQRADLSGDAGRFSRSIFREVLDSGKGVLIPDAMKDIRFMKADSIQGMRLVSVLCKPILAEDQVVALVHLESGRSGHFQPEQEELLTSLLELAGPALAALHAGGRLLTERDELRGLLTSEWSFGRFVGQSAPVRALEAEVRKASKSDFPVLLTGETGTGKGLLARVLHHAGARASEALVTVFAPSLEKGMVETELFGHKRGAFTGALTDRQGKVQAAEKGTLLLDEISEIPLDLQAKLLRLLQEKTYERVGDSREMRADVRVIAATNRDLEHEVSSGRFRRDLYERLNYLPIRVPPLRERREDIPVLLSHCLAQHEAGRWVEISKGAADYLVAMDFTWPGNVRHLEQLAARIGVEDQRHPVTIQDVERLLAGDRTHAPGNGELHGASTSRLGLEAGLPALLAQAEKDWLAEALLQYRDLTRDQIAERLKISPAALYKKIRNYHL